jgi:hypothetical protein
MEGHCCENVTSYKEHQLKYINYKKNKMEVAKFK